MPIDWSICDILSYTILKNEKWSQNLALILVGTA